MFLSMSAKTLAIVFSFMKTNLIIDPE